MPPTNDIPSHSSNSLDTPSKVKTNRKNQPEHIFGDIQDVKVGQWWLTRSECSADKVHPNKVEICGHPGEGCFSLALTGVHDVQDFGDHFTFTGGRAKRLKTPEKTKDQVFEGMSAALALNVKSRNPVRVIRGHTLQSKYAPELGFRYDGLYLVVKAWTATGPCNIKVCKFALKRLENQDPPPWVNNNAYECDESTFKGFDLRRSQLKRRVNGEIRSENTTNRISNSSLDSGFDLSRSQLERRVNGEIRSENATNRLLNSSMDSDYVVQTYELPPMAKKIVVSHHHKNGIFSLKVLCEDERGVLFSPEILRQVENALDEFKQTTIKDYFTKANNRTSNDKNEFTPKSNKFSKSSSTSKYMKSSICSSVPLINVQIGLQNQNNKIKKTLTIKEPQNKPSSSDAIDSLILRNLKNRRLFVQNRQRNRRKFVKSNTVESVTKPSATKESPPVIPCTVSLVRCDTVPKDGFSGWDYTNSSSFAGFTEEERSKQQERLLFFEHTAANVSLNVQTENSCEI